MNLIIHDALILFCQVQRGLAGRGLPDLRAPARLRARPVRDRPAQHLLLRRGVDGPPVRPAHLRRGVPRGPRVLRGGESVNSIVFLAGS